MDVALARCVELPEPDPDEAPLLAALGAAGLEARALAWDDPDAGWAAARMTVLRATWNYPLRPAAFLSWMERTARVTDLWNRLALLRWNLHKRYLLDLERDGLAVTPTELVRRGSRPRLIEIAESRGWRRVVVKPAISAASYRTRRVRDCRAEAAQAYLERLAADGDVLVQDYLTSVEGYGERALIWIDGEITHAVRKSPRFDQDREATSEALPVTPHERALASAVLRRIAEKFGEPPMYARVDLAPGPSGHPLLMELELIEPSLYLRSSTRALSRFVEAIRRRLRPA